MSKMDEVKKDESLMLTDTEIVGRILERKDAHIKTLLQCISDLRAQLDKCQQHEQAKVERLIDALEDMVAQHCGISDDDGELDSMALSANAYAMRVLAEHGSIQILREGGRRIIANWKREGIEK